ncbi:MAG: hypothetical protein WA971_15355 [Microbacterium sp.]
MLTEIEHDLLDGVPVADVLRKLIILGGRAGSTELRDWASRELRGYADVLVDDLPGYRKVPAIIQMDAVVGPHQVSHQTIDPHELPEPAREHITNQVPFFQGIGEIHAMAESHDESKTVRIALPGERVLAHLIDKASGNPYQHINAIYWSVSTVALEGLVDQVRTRLAELLGELRAVTPTGADVPTAAQAANAVNIVIHGKGNSVHVAHADGNGTSALVERGEIRDGRFWTLGKRVGASVVGLATIAATVIAWWQFQGE